MAKRPVFMANEFRPYVAEWRMEFNYHAGLSASQKQKSVSALHGAFLEEFPGKKVLEISTKSLQPEGVALSAFNLKKMVPSLGRPIPVENIFQGGKVFSEGGPYTDLLTASAREAKRDPRLRASGAVIGFEFEGKRFPTRPQTIFYDFIYINALLENESLARKLLAYDAFTDIEFNPEKSINCQANAAAKFVSLVRAGKIDQARDFESYQALFSPEQR